MTILKTHRWSMVAAAASLGIALAMGPAFSAGDPDGTRGPTSQPSKPSKGSDQKNTKKKKNDKTGQLHEDYLNARALIMDGRYEAGIVAMHALGHDENPEVANYIGYASRKLGHYDEAKVWYEKALASDPKHTRTWQYYGMWHLEQGNRLKAEDYLEKIQSICGDTECRDYQLLKGALEGTVSY